MRSRLLLVLLLPLLLLLPSKGVSRPRGAEAPWREGGWVGALALLRPTLPGETAYLEAAGPLPANLRVRILKVQDPAAFLEKSLQTEGGEAVLEGSRAGDDPLDILREAILWGGRRAFITVHRTASDGLRQAAKQTGRLQAARTEPSSPRSGLALSLAGQQGLSLVQELVPRVTEEITGAKQAAGEDDSDEIDGDRGHLSRVELPGQPAGLYVLEVFKDDQAAYIPWLVTELALLGQEDGGRLRVQAVQARDGAPMAGVSARLFEGRKATPLSLDGQGTCEVPAGPGLRRVVIAQAGASHALMAIEGQGSAAVQQRLYAYTERPLYRPGQEVQAKAILRKVEQGENKVLQGVPELPYTVLDPQDVKVAEGKARLLDAATGSYGLSVQLPREGRLGLHRIVFQGPHGPAQAEFKVEKFVKPAFNVAVTAEQGKVGLGDPLSFEADARYFYGAAVAGAKAEWFLYRVAPRSSYAGWGEEEEPAPELVESGEAQLDENGHLALDSFKAESEGLWRLVVKVSDASGQRNSGSAQVRASAGDLVLFVSTDRNVALPGKPFQVTARAMDLEGREQKGVPTTLKVTRIIQEKENQGYWWLRTTALKPGETLASAPGPKASLSVAEGGLFLVVAEARDSKGRPVIAQRLLTVAAEGTPLPPVPDLRASTDKREYKVGETARILVQLPKPRLTLHWSVEHEGLGARHLRKVEGTTAVLEIPITADLQPNAWVVLEIVAGGRRQMAELSLRVPRLDRRLEVQVKPDRERYQPGQTMVLDVEVKDHQGRPSAADLSVGVVDEAIYALCSELNPDPLRFFNPSRKHMVVRGGSTDWSFHDVLRRQRPVWSLRQTRRGEFKADDADKVRQNFKDTAHWVPFIAVGSDGRARAQLTLPDNLTAWRATATAFTADTRVGVGRASRPASKDLQVSLTLPRCLARGEEARVIALVRNLSGKPLSGTLKLEVENGAFKGQPSCGFSLQDQGQHRFALPLLAKEVGRLVVTARVEGGGLKDAERQSVTVDEAMVPALVSGCIVLDGSQRAVEIPAPAGARGKAALRVVPVASVERLVVPSLPYLVQYPYGCVEQTLSSFVPNILVADLVKRNLMPPLDWKQLTSLDRNIQDGVQRVYAYQQPNGGWGWYAPHDFGLDANPHTTGYAVWSMATMRRLGYTVDEGVYARGRSAALRLFTQVARQADAGGQGGRGRSDDPAADAAFLLRCLAGAGEPVAGMLESSADKVLQGRWKGRHVLALLALAAAESRHAKAPALLDRLEAEAQRQGGFAYWSSESGQALGYAGGDLVPTVNALKALALGRPRSPLLPSGEAFLASRHLGRGWYSTYATAEAVALLPYLAQARSLDWKGVVNASLSVQGGPTWDFRQAPGGSPSFRGQAWTHEMDSPRALSLNASGTGLLQWTYAYLVPGSAKPSMKGDATGLELGVRRRLWALRTPQATGNAGKGWVRAPWTGTLRQGDEAWMEVDISCSRSADYLLLEIPIPAGLEPVVKLGGFVLEGHAFGEEEASDTEYNGKPRIEVHQDRVAVLFQKGYPGMYSQVRILLRAGMAGRYRLRPARLSLMSNETLWATCDGVDLDIQEGGKP